MVRSRWMLPRLPMNSPRCSMATISPNGVTRFVAGTSEARVEGGVHGLLQLTHHMPFHMTPLPKGAADDVVLGVRISSREGEQPVRPRCLPRASPGHRLVGGADERGHVAGVVGECGDATVTVTLTTFPPRATSNLSTACVVRLRIVVSDIVLGHRSRSIGIVGVIQDPFRWHFNDGVIWRAHRS